MKIICAGMGKTGTISMEKAFTILGFTVHGLKKHIEYHLDEYIQALNGEIPDFVAMYSNVDVVQGSPSIFFFEELKKCFPEAKVILTERDNVETWVESWKHSQDVWDETINSQILTKLGFLMTPTGRKWSKLWELYKKRMKYTENQLADVYIEHNAKVKATIPRDELLVYNVKQGWKPLCDFLGVEVPDVPFPCLNVRAAAVSPYLSYSPSARKVFKELIMIFTVILLFIATLVYMIVA